MIQQDVNSLNEAAAWHEAWLSRFNEAIARTADPVARVGYEVMRNQHAQLANIIRVAIKNATEPELKLVPDPEPEAPEQAS